MKDLIPQEVVESKIYLIRGQKVMLSTHLAKLYGVEAKVLIQAVKRNMDRFPEDFMFQLNSNEFEILLFKFGIARWGGTRSFPYAFTEQGVAMLSGILNSDRAIAVNIQIMRIFTKLRLMLTDTLELKLEIEEIRKKLQNQDKNIELVFSYLDELINKQVNPTTKISPQRGLIFSFIDNSTIPQGGMAALQPDYCNVVAISL